jgi:hypothetical protein
MLRFIFAEHRRLALHAMLLFAVGAFAAYPIVRYRWRLIAVPPLVLFRAVLRLVGRHPSILRTTAVIAGFNSLIMFLEMVSGWHPLLPKLFCVWTGMNVVLVMAMAGTEYDWAEEVLSPGAEQWTPPPVVSAVCGLLVLALELPCFWFSIGMGMRMGLNVQSGAMTYAEALAPRARAYLTVIVPLLTVSALAEALAIRGARVPAEHGR